MQRVPIPAPMATESNKRSPEEVRRAFAMLEHTYLTAARRRFRFLIGTLVFAVLVPTAAFFFTTPANQNASLAVLTGLIGVGLVGYCAAKAAQGSKGMRATKAMAIALGATPR